jgi:ABC-type antimicrobial peptide transport system permease subunit
MKRGQEIAIAIRLGGVSLIVLLIAAANVANLLLLRASRRKREIALRRALGVSRARLARQLSVESTLLVLLGAIAACVVAIWLGAALRHLVMPSTNWASGAVDLRTVSFVALAGICIGLITALAPLAQANRVNLADSLKAGGRDSAYRQSGLRSTLLAFQAALCTVLLVGTA